MLTIRQNKTIIGIRASRRILKQPTMCDTPHWQPYVEQAFSVMYVVGYYISCKFFCELDWLCFCVSLTLRIQLRIVSATNTYSQIEFRAMPRDGK